MKKNFILAAVIGLLAAVQVSAQESIFRKGDNVVSLGVGFAGNLYSGYSDGYGSFRQTPTFTLSYERCIIDNLFNEQSSLGIGGLVGYSSAKKDYSSLVEVGWTSTDIVIGARGALHYTFVEKFDTYAGVIMGYNINTWTERVVGHSSSKTSDSSGMVYNTFVGGRYYLSDAFAAFAEFGYGYNTINVGLSLRF